MTNEIRHVRKESKKEGLPKGAKVLHKDTDVSVREIENGFIITKRLEIKYQLGDRTEYHYGSKEYYSKKDPLEIKLKDKSLADAFDED